jgi:hypothetical protein
MKRGIWIAWVALVGTAACSDADVAGNYQAGITNRADGCGIGWNVDESSTASFTVTQSGSDVTLVVNPLAGVFVAGLLGTNMFTGGVDGSDISVKVTGTAPKTSGNCSYTYNGKVIATQDGDDMKGRVEYRAATNGDADCASRKNCLSTQEFNATRPPAAMGQ